MSNINNIADKICDEFKTFINNVITPDTQPTGLAYHNLKRHIVDILEEKTKKLIPSKIHVTDISWVTDTKEEAEKLPTTIDIPIDELKKHIGRAIRGYLLTMYKTDIDEFNHETIFTDDTSTPRIYAENIEWDADDDDDISDLPTTVEIPEDVIDETIGEYLSDVYEFCHTGFNIKIKYEE